MAAPVGVTSSAGGSRCRGSGSPSAARRWPGAGTGIRPCGPWMNPPPTGSAPKWTAVDAEQVEADAGAGHVDDRVERADVVELHPSRGGAVHPGLGVGEPAEDAGGSPASGAGGSGEDGQAAERVRVDVAPVAVLVAVGRAGQVHVDLRGARSRPSSPPSARAGSRRAPSPSSSRSSVSKGTPASTSAPRIMSPRGAGRGSRSTRACIAGVLSGSGRGELVDLAGLARGAVAVVDVDHRHAGRARVEHRQQRGQAAERGAVADAGGHGDHRAGRPGRRRTLGSAPSMPATATIASASLEPARDAAAAGAAPRRRRPHSALDAVAQRSRGQRRLLGHRQVARCRRRPPR